MKFKSIRKRDEQHELSRRALIGWMTAAGAALSVPLWKTSEIIEGTHGKAWAADGTCLGANRFMGLRLEVGSFAWITQVFPWSGMAQNAQNNNDSYLHRANRGHMATGLERDLWIAPPMEGIQAIINNPNYLWTLAVAGANQTHTANPTSASTTNLGNSVAASASALHFASSVPRLLPGVSVGGPNFGTAPGAVAPASVGAADDMIALLNSAATSAGGVLSREPNPAVFKQHVDAFLSLNRLSGRATTQSAFEISKTAGFTVGQNFADVLTPTSADLAKFGLDGSTFGGAGLNGGMQDLGKYLIISAKYFINGLAAHTMWAGDSGRRDPHGGFGQFETSRLHAMQIGHMFKAFFDMINIDDPLCPSEPIWKNLVMFLHGDTPKSQRNNNGGNWADGTVGGHNQVVVFGAGYLRAGQYGNLLPNGNLTTWNVDTGANGGGMSSSQLGAPVAGAVNYAVSKGKALDATNLGQYSKGITLENLLG